MLKHIENLMENDLLLFHKILSNLPQNSIYPYMLCSHALKIGSLNAILVLIDVYGHETIQKQRLITTAYYNNHQELIDSLIEIYTNKDLLLSELDLLLRIHSHAKKINQAIYTLNYTGFFHPKIMFEPLARFANDHRFNINDYYQNYELNYNILIPYKSNSKIKFVYNIDSFIEKFAHNPGLFNEKLLHKLYYTHSAELQSIKQYEVFLQVLAPLIKKQDNEIAKKISFELHDTYNRSFHENYLCIIKSRIRSEQIIDIAIKTKIMKLIDEYSELVKCDHLIQSRKLEKAYLKYKKLLSSNNLEIYIFAIKSINTIGMIKNKSLIFSTQSTQMDTFLNDEKIIQSYDENPNFIKPTKHRARCNIQ